MVKVIFTVGSSDSTYDRTFYLENEIARCAIVHLLMGCSQSCGWIVRDLKTAKLWKISDKDYLVKYVDRFLQMCKVMKTLVFLINAH